MSPDNASLPIMEPWYSRLQSSVSVIGKQSYEREDVYQYYVDCFKVDVSLQQTKSMEIIVLLSE